MKYLSLFKKILSVFAVFGVIGFAVNFALNESTQNISKNTLATNDKNKHQSFLAIGSNQANEKDVDSSQVSPFGKLLSQKLEVKYSGAHVQELAVVKMSDEDKARYEMPADFVPTNVLGQTEAAPFSRINVDSISSGQKAIAALGDNLLAVANWYGYSEQSLKEKLLSDTSLHVDRKGRLLNIDAGLAVSTNSPNTRNNVIPTSEHAGSTMNSDTATGSASTTAAPYPLANTFKLHSSASSTRILYLNFTGEGAKPAFTLDSIPSTFNDAEQAMIQKIWQRVTEDYAPFDVDVTTEKPINFSGKLGATILITAQTSTAGGYAYLNSFTTYTGGAAPAFCFQNNLANSEKPIAECISHELGHTLGLSHQGQLPSTAYYGGQGVGETAWAPIMGLSYYKNLSQWSKGEYANANNKEDAYAVMAIRGLKPNADVVGNTTATASTMIASSANGYNNLTVSGLISVPGDVDVFKFTAGAGAASFTFIGAVNSQNLDLSAQLLDASGKVLANTDSQATLNKTLSVNLPSAGTYFVSITGAGRGSVATTGYSNYGSLGQYSIVGKTALTTSSANNPGSSTPPPTTTPPTNNTIPSTTAGFTPITINFSASAPTIVGATIKSYSWNFGDGSASASGVTTSHVYTKAGTFVVVLTMMDNLNRTYTGSSTVTIK